jgi:hypothetical protein
MRAILSFIIPILLTFSVTAQDKHPGANMGDIEAVKAAWIANKLKLTPDEAQQFWPVYNNYEQEMKTLFDQKRKNHDENKNSEATLSADMQLDAKIFYTKRAYFQKRFPQVISAQKVAALYYSEPEFREYLVKQLRSRNDPDRKDAYKR